METNVTHLFLLVESGGEYSESWSKNICFYDSREKAEDIASKANELVKIYEEKYSELYKSSVHPKREDPDWKQKIEYFCSLKNAIENEFFAAIDSLIGIQTTGNYYRYDCVFSIEEIPYL